MDWLTGTEKEEEALDDEIKKLKSGWSCQSISTYKPISAAPAQLSVRLVSLFLYSFIYLFAGWFVGS